jgi:hypothetical protein
MRCACPDNCPDGENFHQAAMSAIAQILERFPRIRCLLDEAEAEVIKCFVETSEAREKVYDGPDFPPLF